MLRRRHIAKLCYGSIIYGAIPSSSGDYSAGEHWLVMLDHDDAIKESETFYVAPISSNSTIDPTYLVPVPSRTGLSGNIICSWIREIHLAHVEKLHHSVLDEAEMLAVEKMIREYRKSRPRR